MQTSLGSARQRRWSVASLLIAVLGVAGCEVDSFFDPSKTGRFEHMATTIPVLDRIDVIEEPTSAMRGTSSVRPEDLEPTTLEYTLSPGDLLTVQIYELYQPTVWHSTSSRINAGGYFRVPEVGDVQAAGMTAQEFEDRLTELLDERVLPDPLVDVIVEAGTGFRYTLDGAVQAPGMYTLQSPDMRLLDVLAIAGGVPLSTRRIYIIRKVNLSDRMAPEYDRGGPRTGPRQPQQKPPVDIEQLIDDLDDGGSDPQADPTGSGGSSEPPRPAMFRPQDAAQNAPPVDIDDLDPAARPAPPPVDPADRADDGGRTYIFDAQSGEWVPIRSEDSAAARPASDGAAPIVTERILEIPYQPLKRGNSAYNVVIRPGDRVYVAEPPQGVVYIGGEVVRPGTYNLPQIGKLTLSRLITSAGGFGPLAIPSRVDLTRVVGDNREATIRLDLAAIRHRTQPDIILKPDDHVLIGTNFWATPVAIARNGFRMTYGFGFLLDRNFGNDVFGAPPTNFR